MSLILKFMFFTLLTPLFAEDYVQQNLDSSIEKAMSEELRLYTKIVQIPFKVFSYSRISKNRFPEQDLETLSGSRANALSRIASFWEEGAATYNNAAGPGLYAALDPLSSKEFGSPDFSLLVVSIPQGTRYLDFGNNPHFSEALSKKIWEKYKCESDIVKGLRSEKASCRTPLIRAIHSTGAEALLYEYKNNANLPKVCLGKNISAVVIISGGLIQSSGFEFFTQLHPNINIYGEDQKAIAALDAIPQTHFKLDLPPLWPNLPNKNSSVSEEWLYKNLWNCQNERLQLRDPLATP